MANLTVEVGNFAPASHTPKDSATALAFADFYRSAKYDAVALSSRETGFGFDLWRQAASDGLPVLAANVFRPGEKRSFLARMLGGKPKDEPVFQPCLIREDRGQKLGVIGFVSPSAWAAFKDSTGAFIYQSPYEMDDLFRRSAKRCDHLTVIGEFSDQEADSLARAFPEIDMIVSSAIRTDAPRTVGETVLVGTVIRGSNANFVDLLPAASDTAAFYQNTRAVLDASVPEDSTILQMLSSAKQRISQAGQK
ncbi:MAG: hypothetical protein PHI18_09510 [bacterium]|nr:hypothetical protein [bacterium]